MALPDWQDLYEYVKGESGTVEQTLLTALIASATAAVQAYVRRPLVAEARTFYLEKPADSIYRTVTRLHLPVYPAQAPDSSGDDGVEITDDDGNLLVEGTDYRVDLATGVIYGLSGSSFFPFGTWPYTITAVVGLSARADYSTMVEPVLRQSILDVGADLYQRRNPAATSETDNGISKSYGADYGLPPRVCAMLDPFRMVRAL